MKILYFTKSKPYTLKALKRMVSEGYSVSIVCKEKRIFQDTEMGLWCAENGIECYENVQIYSEDFLKKFDYDIGISNTFGKRIRKEIIDALDGRIFNLHCAPLPEYRGMFPYNWGIYHKETTWCVTAHYINEEFDKGTIIKKKFFSIQPDSISIKELEAESQKQAYELTFAVLEKFKDGMPKGYQQKGKGHYYSRKDFEELKVIRSDYTSEEIERRIKACYCPGYEGAYLLKDGKRFPIFLEEYKVNGTME